MASPVAAISTDSLVNFNPLLCETCQPWNDADVVFSKTTQFATGSVDTPLQKESSRPKCLMCNAVFMAAKATLGWYRKKGTRFAKDMAARGLGPFSSSDPKNRKYTVDYSQSAESRFPTLMQIHIYTPDLSQLSEEAEVDYPRPGRTMTLEVYARYCLRYSKTVPRRLLGVETFASPYFDIDLLKSWVRACDCEEDQDTDRLITPEDGDDLLPTDFRVIDVQSMNITRPKKFKNPGRFVALSYMWHAAASDQGLEQLKTTNLSALEKVNSLREVSLPSIISDAISLCRALRERYLWVDRLCIVQDDETSKHGQIRAMDVIYQSATFTIMAALNDRETSVGLPGCPRVEGCPGRPRLTSIMGPYTRFNFSTKDGPSPVDTVVDDSLWNTRGWTLQERLLSRRRLFITEFQVIFQCAGGTAYEEDSCMPQELSHSLPAPHHSRHTGFSDEGHRGTYNTNPSRVEFSDYAACVEDYTKRSLSFRSDLLNAFDGVGSSLARGLGTRMLYGLPEKCLHVALFWEISYKASPAVAGCRTTAGEDALESVPSWSWASVQDPVWFAPGPQGSWSQTSITDIYQFEPAAAEQECSLRKVHSRHIMNDDLWASGDIRLRELVVDMPLVLARAACDVARGLPGSLVFNTFTVACRLDLSQSARGLSTLWSPSRSKLVGDISSISAEWRTVYRDRPGDELLVKVVALYGGAESKYHEGQHIFPDLLYVLLVEPDPREPRAVRRVGVGSVKITEAWEYCEPRWKTVVLC